MQDGDGIYYPVLGLVTNRDDPIGRGRVKFLVPGLIEPESRWAWPMGMPGGGFPGRGLHSVPPVGAQVVAFFLDGDPDKPMWMPGPWAVDPVDGAPDGATTDVAESSSKADVHAIETEKWRFVMDDGVNRMRLIHKDSGNEIEWDGARRALTLDFETSITLVAIGRIDLRATQVLINERPVMPNTDTI
jgi:hypothetical protein